MKRLRQFFLALTVGVLLLFQAQATVAAVYKPCCMEQCKGIAQCAMVGCLVCAAPCALGAEERMAAYLALAVEPAVEVTEPIPWPVGDVWTPPD